jgi:hypothetical protein
MQSACWHRLPPPCALQYLVLPIPDFKQPSSSHNRLPPPMAHCTICRPNPKSTAPRNSQPSPTPSQSSTLHQCTPDITHTTVAVREQVRRWVQHVSTKVVKSCGGRDGGCVVGEDGQGLLRTLHRQVRRLLASRAASPNPDGRLEHTPTPHRYTAFTARRRDTLECTCCSEGGLS